MIDSITDNCIRDCLNKYSHTFDHICAYDFQLENIGNNELVNLTITSKSMNLHELNRELKIAGRSGFKINQINKLTLKIDFNDI